MRYQVRAAFVAVLMLAAAAGLFAQSAGGADSSGDSAIFDTSSFDQTVKQATAQEKKDSLSYLVGGSLLFDSSVTAPSTFDGYSSAGYFAGKLFGKVSVPRFGQIYLAYNLEHTLFAGNAGILSGAELASATGRLPNDLFTISYALSEFFFDFDVAKTLFVRLDRKSVV